MPPTTPEPQPAKLRLFIAVAIPEAVRRAATEVVAALRGAGDVRWVTPDRMHLTLKFLGPTPAEKLPAISQILDEKANKFSRFVVELDGAGAFPNPRRPQTLWVGLAGAEVPSLGELAGAIDQGVAALGFPREERPFRPHLTIGRVKSPHRLPELSRRLQAWIAGEGEHRAGEIAWPVEEVELIRSDLRPAGPEYTVLRRFPLRAGE